MASPKPSPKDVVDALQTLTDDETTKLFHHFSIPLHTLTNIKTNHGGTFTIHCVDKWFKGELDASWGNIVAGLRHIGLRVLAEQVATEHNVETPISVADNPTSDPITPPVSAQDSDITQSPVNSESNPVPPPTSVVSTDHPVTDTPNSAPSDSLQPSAPTTHTATVTNDPSQQVKEEMEQFQENFTNMMSMTCSALCKKESEDSEFIEEFRNYLLFLPLSKKAPHAKFFDEREDDIIKAESVRKLLAILGRYCNYSNYDLLIHLINKFCNTAQKKIMQDYCESLERFEMATPVDVYLVAISASPAISEAFSRMAMKMNKPVSECTLHEIRKLKESLTEKAFLHLYSVYIDTIAESSVLVVLRFPPDCIGWVLAAVTPDFMDTHHLTEVSVDGEHLTLYPKLHKELIGAEEDPAHHVTGTDSLPQITDISEEKDPAVRVTEDPPPSIVTDKMSEDVDPSDQVPDRGPPPQITDQISADEEYARQLQRELYSMSDEPDRGGEVTVPLHREPVTERIGEEEDPVGHVMEGPSPSTVTDKMSGPPPQITDQISADEEYACQLQRELYSMSDEPDRGGEVTVPLHREPVTERDDGQQLKEETPRYEIDRIAEHIEYARQLLLQLDQGTLDDDVHVDDCDRKLTETIDGQLVVASIAGDVVRVASLLNSGADVETVDDEDGFTPLHWASGHGHLQTVRLLLQRGAAVDSLDDYGYSPLMWAAICDSTAAVVELLKSGADPNLQNIDGDSAVILATVKCFSGALKELVSAPAKLNLQNQEGLTALMISSRSGRTEVTDILLTGENIDLDIQENNTGWSALFFSAERGDVTTTISLLKAGANAHLKDRNGLTALDIATNSNKGDTEGVCGLLPKYMQESATSQSHHDDAVPLSGIGSTLGQESDQDRPSAGDDIRDTNSTRRRGLSESLRNLANTSGQTIRRLFDELERRLRSTDEKALFYSEAAGGQQRPQGSKRRSQNRQTASSTRERVLSSPNI